MHAETTRQSNGTAADDLRKQESRVVNLPGFPKCAPKLLGSNEKQQVMTLLRPVCKTVGTGGS